MNSESTSAEQKAYEDATWSPENQWVPALERVSFTPSFNPDEEPTETREPLSLRAVNTLEGKVWISAGDQRRDLWWGSFGDSPQSGKYFKVAAPVQAIIVDGEEAWASVYDKGLERLELSESIAESDEEMGQPAQANARFNTPGRAIAACAARSFIVVADGYAGLSLFAKREDAGLGTLNPSRRLITPPQALSTAGRTSHLDLIEDKVISAEYGLGVSISQVSAEGGLQRQMTVDLGGAVRWVHWVDPYTAIAWVDGRGALALDLLADEDGLSVINLQSIGGEGFHPNIADVWTASGSRYALLTPEGDLYHGVLSCASEDSPENPSEDSSEDSSEK